ncbi:PspC domain-containing protein [Carboxylicivirga taeanensis]|uniref:PspC domain-containing protein n=1 Tax=Carboxylicivirga taeanensis TaxID=1416875 RepID=UPI003F6DB469
MKKTVTINISGHMFYIDEDAYTRLRNYLDKIESTFRSQESGDEIISDIESRIAEIFNERINRETGVVTITMVEEVIATMGEPEQFEGVEGEEKKTTTSSSLIHVKPSRRFYRDIDNRVFGGVCAGIAAYFGIDVVIVRVLFVILTLLTWGGLPLIYIILWIALPPALTTAQKLQMRGERITIENIERSIRDEYDEVKKQFGNFKESSTYKKGKSFFSRFSRGEKTTFLIILAVIGAAMFINMPHLHGVFHGPAAVFTGFTYHVAPTFNHIFFPGALTFVLVLLVLGLIFKTILKVVLYLIAFLLLGSLALKVIFWLFGGFMLIC